MGRTYRQLTLEERCTLARLYGEGQAIRQIAAIMGRSASTISREVRRNMGAQVGYKPVYADELRWARRWQGSRMERQPELRKLVLDRLAMGWSPEQVAGRLAHEQSSLRISHESIYRFIYAQITRHNDYSWRHYLPRSKSKRGWIRRPHRLIEQIKDRVPIGNRPQYIEKRRQMGHWEADLLHPRKAGAVILVNVERVSRFVLMAKQSGKHAQPIASQLAIWFAGMPATLRRTLTQDNGPEFFLHHQLKPLGIKTYFCNPHSPWQKGTVENMNARLRRYIPRGTDPETFSNEDLQAIAHRFNHTPRKCLGFKTPAELFYKNINPLHFECESTFPPARE